MSIHPRLKVSVGSNNSKSDKINKLVKVNSSSTLIENELFGGSVFVKLVDYLGPNDNKDNGKPKPDSISTPSTTFSIMIQGRFKDEPNGNDIVFGNVWNHPIKQWLPYGTSAAVKFAETVVDPTLETDLYSDEPWALSPFLSTMNLISVSHLSPSDSIPEFKGELIKESISELFNPKVNNDALDSDSEELKAIEGHADKRRKYMALKENREKIILTKDLLFTSDFFNGFIDFNTLSLHLPIGLRFPLVSYWDGQPVTFTLRNRSGTKNYLFVQFQLSPDSKEEEEALKSSDTTSTDVEELSGDQENDKVEKEEKVDSSKETADSAAGEAEKDSLGVD